MEEFVRAVFRAAAAVAVGALGGGVMGAAVYGAVILGSGEDSDLLWQLVLIVAVQGSWVGVVVADPFDEWPPTPHLTWFPSPKDWVIDLRAWVSAMVPRRRNMKRRQAEQTQPARL